MGQDGTGDRTIALEDVLDTSKAVSLREQFLARRGRDVEIDAAAVRHIGVLCAQVILAAIATWRSENHRLTIVRASESFREGVTILGLHPYLACEV